MRLSGQFQICLFIYLFIYFTKRFSVHKNTYKQKQTNEILTNKNKLTKQKQAYKKQQRQQIFARKSFVCVRYFFVLFVFFALFVRFVRVKSFHKKKERFEIDLIASFTYTAQLKGIFTTLKNLLTIFANFEQSKSRSNSVTYGTPYHAIGPFVLYYHYVTYRTPCHASGYLVIYCKCFGFERAFFTLRCFLVYILLLFQGFPGTGRSPSKLAGLHADIRNIALA